MSKNSKAPQSGLRTVKRDWSEPSLSQKSSEDLIEWPPTPPTRKSATGAEKRLRDIQDALAGRPVSSERILTNASSQVINSTEISEPPLKKARQLPSSWSSNDKSVSSASLSSSTWTPSSSTTSSRRPPVSKSSTSSAPTSKSSRVPAVFLSQEQTHILKLVQEGHSVFYTGSAGEIQ
jgi:ATP-dependent DNA helicase PIF1